jgi:Sec-independent protein translocase protein TatA
MPKLKKVETTGPLLKGKEVLVDPKKFPTLHRSLVRGLERFNDGWERVIELRKKGKGRRLTRKLLGVKPKKKMTDDVKEKLRRGKSDGEEE